MGPCYSHPEVQKRRYAATQREKVLTHHPQMGAVGKPKVPGGESDYHQLLSHSAFTSVNASCRLESLCRVRVNALNTKALDRQVWFHGLTIAFVRCTLFLRWPSP